MAETTLEERIQKAKSEYIEGNPLYGYARNFRGEEQTALYTYRQYLDEMAEQVPEVIPDEVPEDTDETDVE